MAGNDDNGPGGPDKLTDGERALTEVAVSIETKRVLAEIKVILECVAAGLEAIARAPEAVLIKSQLDISSRSAYCGPWKAMTLRLTQRL
jgi:hypothetical protein